MTQDEWYDAERSIVAAWSKGDLTEALALINEVVSSGDDQMRGRALMYRGSIDEERGDMKAAQSDFVAAAPLFSHGSYRRYIAELSVGQASEEVGSRHLAAQWYRAALSSCAAAVEPFSGAVAAKRLLLLGPLDDSDRPLVAAALLRSWQLLEMPGEPDTDDSLHTADLLIERGSSRQTPGA